MTSDKRRSVSAWIKTPANPTVHFGRLFIGNALLINPTYSLYFTSTALYIQHIWVASIFIKCSGHVKKNPDPKPNFWERFCFCHRNLNKLVAHNLVKLPLLQVYISVTNILCYMPLRILCRAFLDKHNLEVTDINLMHADHWINTKRQNLHLLLWLITFENMYFQLLNECNKFEIKNWRKIV